MGALGRELWYTRAQILYKKYIKFSENYVSWEILSKKSQINHRKPDKFNFHEHSGLIETYYGEFDGDCWCNIIYI